MRERRAFRRYPALLAAFARAARAADALLVPEFRHKDMPLARLLAGRRRLVFDPLVSRHDTLVGDWGLHAAGSPQARWNRWLDRWSLALADLVLCDTWAHGALFESLGVPRARLRRVLVGAEDAFFEVGPPPPARAGAGGLRRWVPAAARHADDRRGGGAARAGGAGLPDFAGGAGGTGIEWEAARELAGRLGLRRVSFTGAVPYAEAPRRAGRGARGARGVRGGSEGGARHPAQGLAGAGGGARGA